MKAIKGQSTFEYVNETVLKQLRAWHIRTADTELAKMRKTMSSQADSIALAVLLNNFDSLCYEQVSS